MILRLKLYGLALKAATYLLPILAFFLGWWVWAACCAVLVTTSLFEKALVVAAMCRSMYGRSIEISFGRTYTAPTSTRSVSRMPAAA